MDIWFEYHCYEGEDSGDVELWHHTHQRVGILYEIMDVEREVCRMYQVRFSDGLEYSVFEDELVSSPSEFHRPDYVKV